MEEEEIFIDFVDTDTTCNICYAEFLDFEDLEIHIKQVHNKIEYTLIPCQFCDSRCSDLEAYALHIIEKHINNMRLCAFCTRVFLDHDQHRRHEIKHKRHKDKSIYSCSQCNNDFMTALTLELHEINVHKNSTDGVFIQDCLPHLSSILNISALKFIQSMRAGVEFFCGICRMSTTDPKKYIKHLSLKCRSYSCDNCSSAYKGLHGLKKHIYAHKECYNYVDKNLTKRCKECRKHIPIKMHKKHEISCNMMKCKTCKKTVASMYDLSKHQTEEHPMVVSLQSCRICKKEFVGKLAFERHFKRTHGNKVHLYKYRCLTCETMYMHPKQLFAHYYTQHKDLEPYTCKICDKKFKLRKKFTLHIKMKHESKGFVEFDENYHVFFAETKSANPFQCKSIQRTDNLNITNDSIAYTEKETIMYSDVIGTENENTDLLTERPKRKKIERRLEKDKKYSSDDEPLVNVKKRIKKSLRVKTKYASMNKKNLLSLRDNAKRFQCGYCKKQCYTFQNYHHHINSIHKDEIKKCIKCNIVFDSKENLSKHMSDHTSSRLTEVLKTMIEKRKLKPEMTVTEKFQKTIKKVAFQLNSDAAIVSAVPDIDSKLSVQKFIESFTPEVSDDSKKVTENNITVKKVYNQYRPPVITLTKFQPKINTDRLFKPSLSMPIRFKNDDEVVENVKVSILQSNQPDVVEEDNYEQIPEVAHEVMLEGSEEPPKIQEKFLIPKVPAELNQMRIAHLLPTAPYYKIVKVKDVLDQQQIKKEENKETVKNIKLPDGTKLVNVNPLAHLLKDKSVDKIMENIRPSRYYKPKNKNFEQAVAKAMMKVENPTMPKVKWTRKKVREVVSKYGVQYNIE